MNCFKRSLDIAIIYVYIGITTAFIKTCILKKKTPKIEINLIKI